MTKRILYVTTYSPQLAQLGGASWIDRLQIDRLKEAGFVVEVFSIAGQGVPVSIRTEPRAILRAGARILASKESFGIAKFRAMPGWKDRLRALRDAAEGIDVVVTSQTPSLAAVADIGIRPQVHIAHNVDYLLSRAHDPFPLRATRNWSRTVADENSLLSRPELIAALSPSDASIFRAVFRCSSVVVLDLALRQSELARPPTTRAIGFLGKLSWEPNRVALKILMTEVMPEVRRWMGSESPSLVAAGSGTEQINSDAEVRALGPIEDTNWFYGLIDLVVVPRLMGSTGVSVKLLEAWSRGIHVIAPSALLYGAGARTNVSSADSIQETVAQIRQFYDGTVDPDPNAKLTDDPVRLGLPELL